MEDREDAAAGAEDRDFVCVNWRNWWTIQALQFGSRVLLDDLALLRLSTFAFEFVGVDLIPWSGTILQLDSTRQERHHLFILCMSYKDSRYL